MLRQKIKHIFILLAMLCTWAGQEVFAQYEGQVMLAPLYYYSTQGENLKVIARKYRLPLKQLVSRNRLAAASILKPGTPIIIAYTRLSREQWKNPPDNAFVADSTVAALYKPVPAGFLADSVSLSKAEFLALTQQPAASAEESTGSQETELVKPSKKEKTSLEEEPAAESSSSNIAPESGSGDLFVPETDLNPLINNISPEAETPAEETEGNPFNNRIRLLEEGTDSLHYEPLFFGEPLAWMAYHYRQQPDIIQNGFLILTFFLICNVLLFLVILSSRIYKSYLAFRTQRLQRVYETLLANILFSEFDTPEKKTHMLKRVKKKYLINEFNTEVFLQELLNLHKNFTGDICNDIRDLYIFFELPKMSYRKLRSFPWDNKIKGMRELTQMSIKEAYDEVFKYVDSKNSILRLETLLSLIQLSESDPLKFLSNTKTIMTGWQQVNILAILSIYNTDDLPDFKRWLNSSNDSVVLFTIRMINHFKQIQSVDSIIPMLEDEREEIRDAVVETIGNLELYGFANTLINVYPNQSEQLKKKILRVLIKISDDEQIPFFKQEMFNEDFAIALQASMALAKTSQTGITELNRMLPDSDPRTKILIRHALDKRIS